MEEDDKYFWVLLGDNVCQRVNKPKLFTERNDNGSIIFVGYDYSSCYDNNNSAYVVSHFWPVRSSITNNAMRNFVCIMNKVVLGLNGEVNESLSS